MIACERIHLVPFTMTYLEPYYHGFDAEVTQYQWPDPFPTLEDAQSDLQTFLDEMAQGETLLYAILSKEGAFLGSVEMHGLNSDCPELGVWIVTPERHKGYAYEALSALLDHVRAAYGKDHFFYEADIRNVGSKKLLHKFEKAYDILSQEPESLTTDSGKALVLQGHVLKAK